MPDDNRVIKVHIFGEEYRIRSEFEDAHEAEEFRRHVLEVARYVDQKMREMAERSANRSPKNVAVLVALNVTDELLKLRKNNEDELSRISHQADSLIERLDEKLMSASSGS